MYDAIFVGVLEQVNPGDNLFTVSNGIEANTPFWNLKVLRFHKGLSGVNGYVTVFDDVGSNCSGFLTQFKVGDTILVFAHYLVNIPWCHNFLWGSRCSKKYQLPLKEPAKEDGWYWEKWNILNTFLSDEQQWKTPDHYPTYKHPGPTPSSEGANPWTKLQWALVLSVLMNVALLFFPIIFRE